MVSDKLEDSLSKSNLRISLKLIMDERELSDLLSINIQPSKQKSFLPSWISPLDSNLAFPSKYKEALKGELNLTSS